jgi:hypothetical protein
MASRRVLVAGLILGAVLRAAAIRLPGTGDVVIWKVWSFAGATDLTAMYGVGGSPPERRLLHWHGEAMTVDYPPISLAELALAGRLYRRIVPTFDDGPALDAVVKLPGLLAEIAFVAWLWIGARELLGDTATIWAMLAFWLNPAVLLDGTTLGYLDMQMAVPLAIAVVAAWRGRMMTAGVLLGVAVATKAQAIFVAPVVLTVALRSTRERVRAAAAFASAGAATAVVVLAPFVARGAWSNMRQAIGRLATHDMLSAQAANVWWIFTWILRVVDVRHDWGWWRALTQEVRILAISRAVALGYPNARSVGLLLVAVCVAFAAFRAWRAGSLAGAAGWSAWSLYAYALFAAQVHENHLAPAVVLLAPAAAARPDLRAPFWALTAVVTANLYLFYGLGDGWPPVISRAVTGIDATVITAAASVATFGWFTRRLIRLPR